MKRSERSKKSENLELFLGNFARRAKLANAGDAEGCDRKSQTDAENPVCPIVNLVVEAARFFYFKRKF